MPLDALLLGHEEGEPYWFLNNLYTLKAGGDSTRGIMTIFEFLGPAGFGPPPHTHQREDEMFYVLEGEVTFWCSGESATYGPGGFAFLPRQIPHRFQISDTAPARVLQITTPAQFEDFVRAVGAPAVERRLPDPAEPDVEALVRVSAGFGIDILPPDTEI